MLQKVNSRQQQERLTEPNCLTNFPYDYSIASTFPKQGQFCLFSVSLLHGNPDGTTWTETRKFYLFLKQKKYLMRVNSISGKNTIGVLDITTLFCKRWSFEECKTRDYSSTFRAALAFCSLFFDEFVRVLWVSMLTALSSRLAWRWNIREDDLIFFKKKFWHQTSS